ncbi:hypothetical protein ACA910_004895 [Epithemia clementina (nom. ined.)]
MDLGMGSKNSAVGNAAAKALMQVSKVQEQVLEQEISKYDALLDDDEALEALRRKRLEQMKKEQQNKAQWKAQGHGIYSEVGQGQDTRDVARAFFEASKQSERLVIHFYRPTTPLCDIFHAHLENLAPKHLETKFIKINVEGCDATGSGRGSGSGASYLVEQLGVYVMPTLVVVNDRKVVHHIRGFDELGGGTEDFSTQSLAFVLGQYGGLVLTDDEENPPDREAMMVGVNRIRIRQGAGGGPMDSRYRSLDEEDI